MFLEKDTICIYGGSFNPPLNSHFAIAQEVLNLYKEVKKVIFVPVSIKYEKQGLVANEHRYNMLKNVTDNNPKFEVSNIDFKQNKSMTTKTLLDNVKKHNMKDEIIFLTGSDNLKEISLWEEGEGLLESYKILVKARGRDNIENIINSDKLLKKYRKNIEGVNEKIKSNYNSTYVRKQIKDNKSVRYLMPDEVYKYIEKNNLYKE